MPVWVSRGASSSLVARAQRLRDAEVDDLDEVLRPCASSRNRFSGLMSRWTMPFACAAASADAACDAMRRMRCSGSWCSRDEALGERLALEELHHDERAAVVGGAEVGDVDDVLVADRRRELRLLLEARDDRLALRVLLEQHLHRDALADQRVRRLVDRAHAALADLARRPCSGRRASCRSAVAAGCRPERGRAHRHRRVERRDRHATAVSRAEHASRRPRSSARRSAAGYRRRAAPASSRSGACSPDPVDIALFDDGRSRTGRSQTARSPGISRAIWPITRSLISSSPTPVACVSTGRRPACPS